MNVQKIKEALAVVNNELSTVIDGTVKARQTKGLRSLIAAGQNLEKAEKLIDTAAEQAKPKAA